MMIIYKFYQFTNLEGGLYSYFRIGIGIRNSGGFQEIVPWGLKKGQNFTFEGCILGMF